MDGEDKFEKYSSKNLAKTLEEQQKNLIEQHNFRKTKLEVRLSKEVRDEARMIAKSMDKEDFIAMLIALGWEKAKEERLHWQMLALMKLAEGGGD